MLRFKYFSFISVIYIILFNLAACGGGSSDTSSSGQGPDIPAKTYLYYLTDRSTGLELVAVDPDNPPTPAAAKNVLLSSVNYLHDFVDVTPDVTGYNLYDRSSLDLTGRRFDPYVLAHNSTGFHKISADLTQNNAMTQVSTAPGGTVCEMEEYSTTTKEYYIIESSADNCATINRRQLIHSEMDAATNPIDVPVMPLTELFNIEYELVGWLADNAGTLTRYNPDFSSAVSIDVMPSGVTFFNAWPTPSGNFLLHSANALYLYNPTANSLTNVHTAAGSPYLVIYGFGLDGVIFWEEGSNLLYKSDWEFSSPLVVLATEAGADHITPHWLAQYNKLIYSYALMTGETRLVSLTVDSGAKTILDTLAAGEVLEFAYQTRDRVFYNVSGAATRRAESVRLDATGRQTSNNSRWVGATYGNQLDDEGYYADFMAILLTNTLPGQTNLNGTLLASYDASTMAKVSDIGAFPDGLKDDLFIDGLSQGLLFEAQLAADNSFEVFFLSAARAGSLQRITDNTTDDHALSYSITIYGDIPVVTPFSFSTAKQGRTRIKTNPESMLIQRR